MKRTQIYISSEQYEFLENIAFIESKKEQKRVSISEIIRNAINIFKQNYLRNKSEDQDLSNMRLFASKSLEEIWDNDKDDAYDKL